MVMKEVKSKVRTAKEKKKGVKTSVTMNKNS